jgi:hypothetical protein
VYPGRPAPGHGPDFLDAVLDLDGDRLTGPVKLHRTPADWHHHDHDADPAYDGVLLHVVGADTGGGPSLPTVVLSSIGGRKRLGTPKRSRVLRDLSRLTEERLRSKLRRSGLEWLSERRLAAAQAIDGAGADQALYASVTESLGYSENRLPFAELAKQLPFHVLCSLMRTCADGEAGSLLRELFRSGAGFGPPSTAWWRFVGTPPMTRDAWRTGGVRPSNHPERRLEAAAHLVARFAADGFALSLQASSEAGDGSLVRTFIVASPGDGPALIGTGRAKAMAMNAVIPVLAAMAHGREARRLAALFESFPSLEENTVTGEARRMLGENGRMRLGACEQLGLMRAYRLAVAG